MVPPPLSASTSATVGVFPLLDKGGGIQLTVIIKQRFHLWRGRLIAAPGAAIHPVDEPWDPDSPASSIKIPADLCIRKPGTDVVVVGEAVAPREQPVRELDVSVSLGPLRKTVRVFGPRAWYSGLGSVSPTPPQPFVRQPIRWEDAFGGMDSSDPKRALQEPRNPAGRGIAIRPETLVNQLVPHVEDPGHLLKNAGSRPPPAGLGPLGPHFQQRLRYAGTMNQKWQDERCPLVPLDFDERFNQVAVPELISPTPLHGGERVECTGLHPLGPLVFELPRVTFGARASIDDRWVDARPVLDTVLLEPNIAEAELTWRTAFAAPGPVSRMAAIEVFEKERRA
jgi:hypothetical protein